MVNTKAIGIAITIAVAIAVVILVIKFGGSSSSSNSNRNSNSNKNVGSSLDHAQYNAPKLGHPAACVDCERQFPEDQQWRGQRSKCLDCETDAKQRCGNSAVYNATKQKLFDV